MNPAEIFGKVARDTIRRGIFHQVPRDPGSWTQLEFEPYVKKVYQMIQQEALDEVD